MVPKVQTHKSGQARVTLCGKSVYLGKAGSPEAKEEYARVIQLYLNAGRIWPPPQGTAPPVPKELLIPDDPPATVHDLCEYYLIHLRGTLGKKSKTYLNARRATSMLLRSGAASVGRVGCRVEDFGPVRLTAYQAWLSNHPDEAWARSTINNYVAHVMQMFKWAVSRQYLHVQQFQSLGTVRALRRGRRVMAGSKIPREGDKVRPPDPAAIKAVKAYLPRMIAAMVDLQLLTGMRPNEVCSIRPADLKKTATKGVVAYGVLDEANKTAWLDIERTVYIGPKGMAILKPLIPTDPEEYIFSPAKSEADRLAERRASRTMKMWPSHDPLTRAHRRGQMPMKYGERYTPEAYAKAIYRACDRCNVDRAEEGLDPIEAWYPYQLRHAAASFITEKEGIAVAQVLLGHRSIETTIRYVTVRDGRAAGAAKKHG